MLAINVVWKVKHDVCIVILEGGKSKIGFSNSSSGSIRGIIGWKTHVNLMVAMVFLKSD